ncbi:hypothetical protein L7F22_063192 [Adiantum nelumboides]|nr:hypothetical protein [Adiantum nelumboides]
MAPCFDREVTNLLCTEGSHESDCEDNAGSSNGDLLGGGKAVFYMPPLEDDDFIFLLMQKEGSQMNEIRGYIDSYQGKGAELRLRAQMVNWMLYRGETWLLQLVATGSISLAAKLQETEVPLLVDLQVGDIEHVFESCTIQRMELLIMSTLNWEMISATPFSYLHYLLQKCDFLSGFSQVLISRSEELILHSSKGKKRSRLWVLMVDYLTLSCSCSACFRFLAYSPSVVAVASLTEVMEWACLMDEMLQGERFWTSPSNKVAFSKSSAPQSPMGVLDAACFSSESCDRTLNAVSATSRSACKRSLMNTNNALRPISLTNTDVSTATNELAVSTPTISLPPQLPAKRRKHNEQSSYSRNEHLWQPLAHSLDAKGKAKVEEEEVSLPKDKDKEKKQEEVDATPIKRARQEEAVDSEADIRRKTKESAKSSKKKKTKPRQKLTIKDFSLGESSQPYDLVDDVSMQGPKISWPQLLYLSPKVCRQW